MNELNQNWKVTGKKNSPLEDFLNEKLEATNRELSYATKLLQLVWLNQIDRPKLHERIGAFLELMDWEVEESL